MDANNNRKYTAYRDEMRKSMTGAAASLHHVDIEIRFGEAHKREFIVNVSSLFPFLCSFFLTMNY